MRSAIEPEGLSRERVESVVCVLGLVPAVYWWRTYSGPCRWASEKYIEIIGSYQAFVGPVAGLMMALVLCLVPALLMVRVLVYKTLSNPPGRLSRADAGAALTPRIPTHYMIAGLVFVAYGVLSYWHASDMRLLSTSAHEIERDGAPRSRWLEIAGRPLLQEMAPLRMSHTPYCFVPLVSAEWQVGQPVAVLLKIRATTVQGSGAARTFRGVNWWGLDTPPPPVHLRLERSGLVLTKSPVVLSVDDKPGILNFDAPWFLAIGLAMIGYGLWKRAPAREW